MKKPDILTSTINTKYRLKIGNIIIAEVKPISMGINGDLIPDIDEIIREINKRQ